MNGREIKPAPKSSMANRNPFSRHFCATFKWFFKSCNARFVAGLSQFDRSVDQPVEVGFHQAA